MSDSERDDDASSLSSCSYESENPYNGYISSGSNGLGPGKRSSNSKDTLPTSVESGSDVSSGEDSDDDDDESTVDGDSDDESLGLKKAADKPKKLVEDLGDSVDSWHFDLGALEANLKMVEEANKTRQANITETVEGLSDVVSRLSGLDDELSCIEKEISKADRSMERMESKKSEIKKDTTEAIKKRQVTRQKSFDMIEKRKAERAARLERAKKRVDAKKEAERLKKEQENQLDMSEEARKQRAYQWYSRCGHPTKKDFKKRIKSMGKQASGVSVADIDLLPWNFNGSMINASKMMIR